MACPRLVEHIKKTGGSAITRKAFPYKPLNCNTFLLLWRERIPAVKIKPSGTDFCDTCTALRNLIASDKNEEVKETLGGAIIQHRKEADAEPDCYGTLYRSAKENLSGPSVHLTFDFTEKVLLPSLFRKPCQLHFVTGLKFDIFAIGSGNLGAVYIYGLPEGH